MKRTSSPPSSTTSSSSSSSSSSKRQRRSPLPSSSDPGAGNDDGVHEDEDQEVAVAFQGELGSYSDVAVSQYWCDQVVDKQPCHDWKQVFVRIASGRAAYGCVPVENSSTGLMHKTLDLVLRYDLHIVGEIVSKERHCLCALPGTSKGQLTSVRSHPLILDQCGDFLKTLNTEVALERGVGAEVAVHPSYDTAGACAEIKQGGLADCAAIASPAAAKIHGLEVLEVDVSNDSNNETRFIIVAAEPCKPVRSMSAKTSVAIGLPNEPGALFKALACFALRDLNILCINTRPASRAADLLPKKWHWNMVFFVDFQGSVLDDKVAKALGHLEEVCISHRVLGSFRGCAKQKVEAVNQFSGIWDMTSVQG